MAKSDARFVYESSNVDVPFSEFEELVEQKQSEMVGLIDEWGAAEMVANELTDGQPWI